MVEKSATQWTEVLTKVVKMQIRELKKKNDKTLYTDSLKFLFFSLRID